MGCRKYVILTILSFFAVYGFADAVLALRNPGAWLRANWTARRGFHADADRPPSADDIRTMACSFSFLPVQLDCSRLNLYLNSWANRLVSRLLPIPWAGNDPCPVQLPDL